MFAWVYDLPVGPMTLAGEEDGLAVADFGARSDPSWRMEERPLLRRACEELREYFAGRRREFDLPLAPRGTDFQRAVWEALRAVPYGQTRSYGQIAAAVGRPRACRAVGLANNRNPIAIIVPCHRVVGADGSLTGYAAGLSVKAALLELEKTGTFSPSACRQSPPRRVAKGGNAAGLHCLLP